MTASLDVDLLPFGDPAYQSDPYPYYDVVRDLTPVYASPSGVHAVMRHADIFKVLRDKRLSSRQLDFGVANLFHDSMFGQDSPDHGRLRKLSTPFFSPGRAEEWNVVMRQLVDQALDETAADGGMDVCQGLSFGATFGTMAHILGVGTHEAALCRQKVIEMGRALTPSATEADVAVAIVAFEWCVDYVRGLIEEKRRKPGDALLDVYLSALESGGMTEREVMSTVTFFYAVGHLDNSFLIQNGVRLLAEMPEVRRAYIEQPELRASIVEEILRVDAAEQFVTRAILEDIEIDGEILPAGGVAVMMLGSGNVDERAYERPREFDFTRPDLARKQLAFGAGQHGCQGQMLARAQGEIALTALLERYPDYEVSGEVVYGHNEFIRAIRYLPIEFH